MTLLSLSRREALAGLAATTALPLISTRAFAAPATEARANALLGSIADNLLRLSPTGATALGIDTGKRASYRSRLEERSPPGRPASQPRSRLTWPARKRSTRAS